MNTNPLHLATTIGVISSFSGCPPQARKRQRKIFSIHIPEQGIPSPTPNDKEMTAILDDKKPRKKK